MSGLEVLAVVSAAAALVSAFQDGSRIVKELRERREARRGPPPTKFLQESLDRGPPAIEEAKRVGLERFGHRFGVGDRKYLQRTLLVCLTPDRYHDHIATDPGNPASTVRDESPSARDNG